MFVMNLANISYFMFWISIPISEHFFQKHPVLLLSNTQVSWKTPLSTQQTFEKQVPLFSIVISLQLWFTAVWVMSVNVVFYVYFLGGDYKVINIYFLKLSYLRKFCSIPFLYLLSLLLYCQRKFPNDLKYLLSFFYIFSIVLLSGLISCTPLKVVSLYLDFVLFI